MTQPCSHWWVFEGQVGAKSRAVCKYCGATQEAYNYLPYDKYDFPMNVKQVKRTPINDVDSILINTKSRRIEQRMILEIANEIW